MKIIIATIVVIIAAALAIFGYTNGLFDNLLNTKTEAEKQFEERQQWLTEEDALRDKLKNDAFAQLTADTHGGKTPEETLNMYMDALRNGDAELAAKYYLPWEQDLALKDTKDWITNYKDGLALYLDAYDAGIIRYDSENVHDGIVYSHRMTMFANNKDKYGYGINMELNEINNIWKIHEEKFVKEEDKDKY